MVREDLISGDGRSLLQWDAMSVHTSAYAGIKGRGTDTYCTAL